MKKLFFLLIFPVFAFSQQTVFVEGIINDENGTPIEGVSITYNKKGTTSNKKGYYQITIPIEKTTKITFSHISYNTITKSFTPNNTSNISFSLSLESSSEKLKEIEVNNNKKEAEGITTINTAKAKNIVGANAGVENILMTLPGVNNNNELSTQYNVRGGNFDENLVYVNGIEIYRPFLIRSGQQEGLSFINPHMIRNINFSAGGFQAKYGDRLSSVLDITYRKPKNFATQLDLSFLGGSFTIEDTFYNNKLSAIIGIRYRNNNLFVQSKQTEVNFRPTFTDIQSFLSYDISKKLTVNFLGNFSLNNYHYQPITRRTRFGTIANPLELIVFYDGQEKDQFKTSFGAFSADYQINEDINLTGTIATFHTQEEEYFDIAASYHLGEVDNSIGSENFGDVEYSQGIGSQLNHARNDLDALISSAQIRASIKNDQNEWRIGIKYQKENIKDRINEWEIIDSLGFSVRPPHHSVNNQPYEPYTSEIEPFQNIKAKNNVTLNRLMGFAQFSKKTNWKDHDVWYNLGIRYHYWNVSPNNTDKKNYFIWSPRAQFAIKPDWETDMLFRLSGGWYAQPPFYKEFRNYSGEINPDVKAQESIHLVLGNDYSFTLWNRPFKLTTELYYKNLNNVNAYSIDNIRIRYRADNLTKAFAHGLDVRLNGEFVPGNDSWISFGYLKTQENIDNRGYIARPTDQRLKFGILFQDYVPNLPSLKAHLNIVYNTGLPGGAPAYADVYQFQNRLSDYKRADLGISYIITDQNKQVSTGFLKYFKTFSIGLELFNVFDIQNAITNTWVRDAYSKQQYAIPNYMTGRVLNFNLRVKM